jgi:ketosteroid isomerase-like protein
MRATDAENVVVRFNDAINRRDLGSLAELMTEDHTLIAGEEEPISGRETCLRAWERFFELLPDYRNVFQEVRAQGALVRVRGRSICSDECLNGPAIWTAVVEGRRVREWRVHEDTPRNRGELGFDDIPTFTG